MTTIQSNRHKRQNYLGRYIFHLESVESAQLFAPIIVLCIESLKPELKDAASTGRTFHLYVKVLFGILLPLRMH
jgi:hypothetical protein